MSQEEPHQIFFGTKIFLEPKIFFGHNTSTKTLSLKVEFDTENPSLV